MVWLAFEMLKKMFPMASTLMRAASVGIFGTVTGSEPSFGVLLAITIGKVRPPSVESRITTSLHLTGELEVLATSHVTVCNEPPVQVSSPLGCVTINGPLLDFTLTRMSL